MASQIDLKQLNLVASPHIKARATTQHIMIMVCISLLPLCVNGVILFGIPALITLAVSVVSCVVFEWVAQKLLKKPVAIQNGSAVVTGLLLALVVSPVTPVWMIILGAFFAIVIGKEFFGGIGSNVFNPALIGRGFMVLSFAAAMGTWVTPVDAISTATVLATLKTGDTSFVTSDYFQLFIGNQAGTIGETSAMLILIAAVFLLITKIIDWRAPLAMTATVAILTFFSGADVLAHLLSGGLLFGAVFMTTDYTTAPVTAWGRVIFGFGCGLITFLIRQFGGLPEGVMFSILIMNAFTPFLNKIIGRKAGEPRKTLFKKSPGGV
ncbi:MAG: RnfABCDGE type electron transport complex subunit D [Spirochaetales bacterium]